MAAAMLRVLPARFVISKAPQSGGGNSGVTLAQLCDMSVDDFVGLLTD
jgi:hypothetical protein